MPFPNKSVVTMSRVSPARKRLVSSARSAAGMSPIKEALENPASVSRPSAASTALHSTSGWRGRGGGTRTVRDGSTHETATDGMCFPLCHAPPAVTKHNGLCDGYSLQQVDKGVQLPLFFGHIYVELDGGNRGTARNTRAASQGQQQIAQVTLAQRKVAHLPNAIKSEHWCSNNGCSWLPSYPFGKHLDVVRNR